MMYVEQNFVIFFVQKMFLWFHTVSIQYMNVQGAYKNFIIDEFGSITSATSVKYLIYSTVSNVLSKNMNMIS